VAQSTSVVLVSTTLMNPSGVDTATAAGHSSVVIASNTPSPSASSTPSQATEPNSSNSGLGSGGLSVGDKAGIASTVLTAVTLIVAILAWRFLAQRKSSI
jgi:hypothetical protein